MNALTLVKKEEPKTEDTVEADEVVCLTMIRLWDELDAAERAALAAMIGIEVGQMSLTKISTILKSIAYKHGYVLRASGPPLGPPSGAYYGSGTIGVVTGGGGGAGGSCTSGGYGSGGGGISSTTYYPNPIQTTNTTAMQQGFAQANQANAPVQSVWNTMYNSLLGTKTP